jgi:hypothetical protein
MLFISLGIKPYSQWFKGTSNKVSDVLSRNNIRDNKELTIFVFTARHRFQVILKEYTCPTKIPHG